MRTLGKQSQDSNPTVGRHAPERSTRRSHGEVNAKKRGPVGPRPCWLSLEAVREARVKLRRAFAGGGDGCAVGGKRKELVGGVPLVVYLGVEHADRGELRHGIFPAQGIRDGIGGIGWAAAIRT